MKRRRKKRKSIIITKGIKVNRLTAIKLDHIDFRFRKFYLFKCECGNKKVLQCSLVTSGNTKSCGCWAKDVKAATRLPNNKAQVIIKII